MANREFCYNTHMSKRVFVAMSGGVDSSVTAYLLKKAGYEVQGIHLELPAGDTPVRETDHSDLENTCQALSIPLHYLKVETEFKEKVIDYFCEEYYCGHTPNPCVQCNRNIKFGLLLDRVLEMKGDYLATGHYARIDHTEGDYRLLKGVDKSKDQSYFLYLLGQRELEQVLFPLGGLHKTQVKKIAASEGLPAAVRRESQDICFLPDGDYHTFISRRISSEPGEIVDAEGRVVGLHNGLAYYTIGQRQGLGISSKEPLYVIELDSKKNQIIIGPVNRLFKTGLIAYNLSWVSGKTPERITEVSCKVRYRTPEAKATLSVEKNLAEVCFESPQRAIAPGQSVVFYRGEAVLGGGIIGSSK
jgi:tRNA-uridine 2-sulfurtransferase